MKHRQEIDGLRAIAVLPVIFFHAGVRAFSGGFVGVDIFFVLSGYLITGILLSDLESGRFSIARFYERRIRRIVPALALVIIATLPFAWLWMTPDQFKELGASIASIVAFVSNFFFWIKSDYFAGSSELKPFLHTWSLAVEEQFYVLFPLYLYFVWRWNRRWLLPSLLGLTFVSLALCQWASAHVESANFFLAPSRAWELLVGSLCAYIIRNADYLLVRPTRWFGELLASMGLIIVIASIFMLDEQMRLPNIFALAPVGGTALIILFGGSETVVARILSFRAFVGVGLISYSAYLWHQPLFALARLRSETEPPIELMVALAILALVLAALSWKYVEEPFRTPARSFVTTRRRAYVTSSVVGIVLAGAGVGISAAAPATLLAIENPILLVTSDKKAYEPQGAFAECPGLPTSSAAVCRKIGDGPRRVVIWGDSHANALSAAIYPVPGVSIYVVGQWGCPPLIGVARTDGFGNASNCNRVGMTNHYASYVLGLHPEIVFLVARWTLYSNGLHFGSRLQRDTYFLTDGSAKIASVAESRRVLAQGLGQTVDRLRQDGAQTYVVEQVPDLHDFSPRGLLLNRTVPRAPIEMWHASERSALLVAKSHSATLIQTHDLFCDLTSCMLRSGDIPLYIDDSHLNYYGASKVFERLRQIIDRSSSNLHPLK